jgi:hypothetical protein
LYSTFFVANAALARLMTDAFTLFRFIPRDDRPRRARSVSRLCAILPLISLSIYLMFPDTVALVLAGGVAQSLMLPIIGGATLYLRYRRTDARLLPGGLWDGLLWLSCIGLLVAGGATVYLNWLKNLFAGK